VEVTEAKETLGILLTPSGSMEGEYNKLKELAIDWVQKVKQEKLTRTELWVALQSTIWRTLSYPLPAINLSKTQWKKIMCILLSYALPAMGICRTFPRAIVFAPEKYLGLGLCHLHTMQEITRVQDLIIASSKDLLPGSYMVLPWKPCYLK